MICETQQTSLKFFSRREKVARCAPDEGRLNSQGVGAMKRISSIAAGIAATIAAAPQFANACAMCGLSPGDSAGHAYNTSVLFMLAGPYITVLAIGGIVFAVWRRAQRKERATVAAATRR